MFYKRTLQDKIKTNLFKGKVIILYGARRTGKTTLVKEILTDYPDNSRYINCELLPNKIGLETTNDKDLKNFLGDKKLIVLDEAQRIINIGLTLKIIVDTFPEYQIIATGSSSFDLANKISEPLTGRTYKYLLYPFSLNEIKQHNDIFPIENIANKSMRMGMYPSVFVESEHQARIELDELTGSYLYKDILEYENIKRSDTLIKLLQSLALQLGSEVSLNELANHLNINKATVDKYLDLLEMSFVVFRLRSFSRNLRKELAKSFKVYFYDLGIRNSLIQNFNRLDLRTDTGALWENFCIVERLKFNQFNDRLINKYFWRTYNQQEIDYIEEHSGQLDGYEFKWGKEGKPYIAPDSFVDAYENATVKRIDPSNYLEFLINN